jgi:phosphoserine phosphatase
VKLASGSPKGAIRVLVGIWGQLRADPAAHLIEEGPAESGVYADFKGNEPIALDQGGGEAEPLGHDAGLVAATSRYGGPPVWLVTGGTEEAVRAAAEALDAEHLRDHYAVAIEGSKVIPLPVEGR